MDLMLALPCSLHFHGSPSALALCWWDTEALPSASWQLLGEPALCLFPSQLSFVLCGHSAQSHRAEISSITLLKKKNGSVQRAPE